MAVGIGLRESRYCSEEAFKAIWGKATDYILFECLDDQGSPQGCAVGKIDTQYRCDGDGGFLQLQYILVQDPYYAHWVEENDGSKLHHHVCRKSLSGCMRKVGRQSLVHIQRWAFITSEDVDACQREWKVNRLDKSHPGGGRGSKLVPMELSSKSKPAKPVRREASPDPAEEDDPYEDDSLEEERSPAKGRKPEAERRERRKRRSGHEKSRRRRPVVDKTPMDYEPEEKNKGRKARSTPLDDMIDADGEPDYIKADNRFEELRKSLEEKKRKRGDEKAGASAVLAKRAQAGVERGKDKKRKKKSSEKEKVTKALKVLAKGSGGSCSGSSEDSSCDEDDENLLGSKSGDLMSRQKKLRRLSSERPGLLLLRGFSLMHEQLGTLHGDMGGEGSAEDMLRPAALRYLLTSAFAQMNLQHVGEQNLREMRTLATALDLLVGGKVSMAGDMMMQRLKSILMGIRDNSTAASRYLELIPMETYPTASTLAEADYARNLALRNAKSEELMQKVNVPG